ncbi:DUF2357 domain-containing protein [Thermaerobacillus caldiproteolyticus]|uniref:DUF2357 domain-containing protein n=1 Tax=Thermaerobacillus caldiproteolyticus TaxID=247480 RepID=UPI0018F18F7A|nr:DUF2357 domain-containing protein [Anoxybacillus caldiproteolyticus]
MGKGELLTIKTDKFLLSFVGPMPCKNSFVLNKFSGGEKIQNKSNEIINIVYSDFFNLIPIVRLESKSIEYKSDNVEVKVNSYFHSEGTIKYLPLFYENIDYQVHLSPLEKSNKNKYTLWHEHSSINKNLSYFDEHQSFSGTFNFRNDVGTTKFEIKENDRIILTLHFTVFSLKVDYLTERFYMINELKELHNNLLFELFKPTSSNAESTRDKTSGLEWLISFYKLSNQLIDLINRIEKKAHNKLVKEKKIQRVDKLKRPSKELLKQVNKLGKEVVLNKKNVIVESKKTDLNTDENKYIKYLIRTIIKKGNTWISYIKNSENKSLIELREEHFFKLIQSNFKKLTKIVKNDFWSKVEDNSEALKNKTNFIFHDEFMKFEKLVKLTKKGVTLQQKGNRSIFTVSMDDLYEYWTFCKLAEIVSGILYNDEKRLALKIKTDAFRAILETGQASKIYIDKGISLSTNRLFKTDLTATYFSPFVSQKPDLVFEIKNNHQLNILDAKYKLDIALRVQNGYKSLSNKDLISLDLSQYSTDDILYLPKDEDINTMHRYKDAIQTNLIENGHKVTKKAVNRGIILYPHKPSHQDENRFKEYLQRIDLFKIGAIPLAPGKKDVDWKKYNSNVIPENFVDTEQIRLLATQVHSMLYGS